MTLPAWWQVATPIKTYERRISARPSLLPILAMWWGKALQILIPPFFSRTHLTSGLKNLVECLIPPGKGGDPVIQLQTPSAAARPIPCSVSITW